MKTCKKCGKEMRQGYNSTIFTCTNCYFKNKNEKNRQKLIRMKNNIILDNIKVEETQTFCNKYIIFRDRQNSNKCFDCKKELYFGKEQVHNQANASHIYSVGANPNLRYVPENIVTCCFSCNNSKHETKAGIADLREKWTHKLKLNSLLKKSPLSDLSNREISERYRELREKEIITYDFNDILGLKIK